MRKRMRMFILLVAAVVLLILKHLYGIWAMTGGLVLFVLGNTDALVWAYDYDFFEGDEDG